MSGLGDIDLTFDDLDADADGCLASTPHAADPPNNSSSAATQGGRGADMHADLAMSDAAGAIVQDTQVLKCTCFTSTRVQILAPAELRASQYLHFGTRNKKHKSTNTGACGAARQPVFALWH
jgi:hypothetical protein